MTVLLFFLPAAGVVWLMAGCGGEMADGVHRVNEEGLTHLEAGRYPEAVETFQKACGEWPAERTLWINLARTLVLAHRRGEAMAAYEQAIMLPDDRDADLADRTQRDNLLLDYAALAVGLHRTGRALVYVEKVAGTEPGSSRAALAYGILLRIEGRFDDALRSFDAAGKLWDGSGGQTEDGEPLEDIGLLAQAMAMSTTIARDGSRAQIDDYLQTLKGKNLRPALMVRVAIALLEGGRNEDALEWAKRATVTGPELGRGWHVMALALQILGRNDEAIPVLQQASKARLADPEAVVHYAAEMLDRGLEDEALNALRELSDPGSRVSEIDGGSAIVEMAIGSVYARRGQRLLAREHIERALQIDPDCTDAAVLFEKITGSPPPKPSE